ncbi:uncharacterized protein LOC142355118 [Convolutriloba macropyga]|uniref:uncharacterized protein LOC142355118 n=1 Tax=Convolutriloba macropyga TaxID=536237 RepID=UPI003F52478E
MKCPRLDQCNLILTSKSFDPSSQMWSGCATSSVHGGTTSLKCCSFFPDVERLCHMVSSRRHHILEVLLLFPDVERVCHMVSSRRHHIVEVFFFFPDVERVCHIVSSRRR